MKLRNKKTGEIATVEGFGSAEGEIQMTYTTDNDETKLYLYCTPSLTTFNEEWEDVPEEPTGYWYIDFDGDVLGCVEDFDEKTDEERKQIGNYFETKEEAEKAVEKLKAWKRLKDKGFRFKTYQRNPQGTYDIYANWEGYMPPLSWMIDKDLDLLFGGEE